MSSSSRIILITGAGGGLGRAMALAFAAQGDAVAVHYHRNRDGADAVVSDIVARGGRAATFSGDLTSPAACASLVADVEAALGPLDVLVNNAGDLLERRTLFQITPEFWQTIVDVNITSTLFCTQAAARGMVARTRGAIVNVSSLAAHNGGGPGASTYAAAKAAILSLSKGLARELAPHGVRLNCVSPGLIGETNFHGRFTAPEAFAVAEKTIPLGHAGTPDDVASVVVFLAGPHASFIVGETVEINGGAYMR